MQNNQLTTNASYEAKRSFFLLFLTVFIPFGMGHFISYLYRTINAVIYNDLAKDLNLPAENLGLLTAVYFLAFAAAQLPLGVMLDRYGPRSVQSPMLIIAAIGSIIFASSHSMTGLLIGRGLIGLGVAGSLMSAIKACSIWLPIDRLPLSTACLLSIGGFGAMASTAPLHAALNMMSWRQIFFILAGLTIFVSVIIYLSVRGPFTPKNTSFSDLFREVGRLYKSKTFWRIALYSVFADATYMAILALWMGPWLHDVAGLQSTQMAKALLFGTFGMVAGSLGFGFLTDYLRKFNVKPMLICGVGIFIFVIFQTLMLSGLPVSPFIITIGFSFFGTAATMNYAIIAQSVDPILAGRVSSSFNLVVFILAFIIQWVVGILLSHWQPIDGHYPVVAYQWSLALLIILQIPGLLIWMTFKPWQRTI